MRLTDTERAFEFLTEQLVKETGAFSKGVNKGLNIARSALRNVDAIPTIDAVEVVRCKDCYFVNCYDELSPRYECTRMLGSLQVKPDDFCSYGKRRGE